MILGICRTKQPEQVVSEIIAIMNATSTQIYFGHPRVALKYCTNENTNGLLCQYVAKRTYKVSFLEALLSEYTEKLSIVLENASSENLHLRPFFLSVALSLTIRPQLTPPPVA